MTLWKTLSIAASLLCLAPPNLMAEEPAPRAHAEVQIAPKDVQTAVFVLQHADAKAVAKLLADFTEYLGGSIKANVDGHSLAVVGTKELVAAVGEALKRLDTDQAAKAARKVGLTFHLLWLTKNGQIDADLPAELQGVITQMKGIYKGIRLLGSTSVLTKEGSKDWLQGLGTVSTETGALEIRYSINYEEIRITAGSGTKNGVIQSSVGLCANVPLKDSHGRTETVNLGGRLDIYDGQSVAVASTSAGSDRASLCLVVSAKVVD